MFVCLFAYIYWNTVTNCISIRIDKAIPFLTVASDYVRLKY